MCILKNTKNVPVSELQKILVYHYFNHHCKIIYFPLHEILESSEIVHFYEPLSEWISSFCVHEHEITQCH